MNHVHEAMCAIKKVLAAHGGITKDRKAPDQIGGYAFRGIDDADNVLCGITAEHGIMAYPVVLQCLVETQVDAKGRFQRHVRQELAIDWVSAVDGSERRTVTWGEGIDTGDKGTGKAFSNARKQAVLAALMIPTHGENIEEHATEVGQPAPPPAPQSKPALAKTKKKNGPPDDNVLAPVPIEENQLDATYRKISESSTFPMLYSATQFAAASQEPVRSKMMEAIIGRGVALFATAPSMEFVREGYPLVQELGQPDVLKRAANAAYERFRSAPS